MNSTLVSHEESTNIQQYQHMQQQPIATSSGDKRIGSETQQSTTSNTSLQSKYPKLDGVLYHFYSKTVAVITNGRLTHYEASDFYNTSSTPSTPLVESPTSTIKSGGASTPYSSRRPNKWFDLEIADYDIFREEVRLWRNISAMIPLAIFEEPASSTPVAGSSYVPPMILDVILDTSSLSERHLLMMDQVDVEGSRGKRRVRVDGKEWGTGPSSRRSSIGKSKEEQDKEQLDTHRKPIVLESWKLEFGVCNPPDPPDLPTLYRHATSNLKELFSLTKQLPAYPLFDRLQRAKELLKQGRSEYDSEIELLKIGIRLRVEEGDEDGISPVLEPLGPIKKSSSSESNKVTNTFFFQPLLTPIGTMNFSVEYRVEADFYVDDLEARRNLRDLELDEDYFRPSTTINERSQAKIVAIASTSQSGPRSLLSATSDRRQSIIASEFSSSPSGRGATPSPPSDLFTRSPGPSSATLGSVFSTSTSSGKPVAGLSSLRRSPSTTAGHGTSPTTNMTALNTHSTINTSSPTASNLLGSDAAFLTHGRRSSTSERRIRTLSTMSGSGGATADKASPPATSAGSNSPSYQPSSRPILARAVGSSLAPSLRSGSYSPSSPSPLAQQLSAHQHNQVIPPQSSFRMSSSPSFRTASLPLSCSPNLRSVFQSYTPSQSQASISSLSKTPPKSITEGVNRANNSSSLGLHGGTQNSPSQSSLAEGRQPSVAPQMIKRYSSTFNYRQGRQASNTSIGGGGGTGGATGSSLESEGSGGNGPYSKSWQARIEQRQMFTARSLGKEEGSQFSGSSGAQYFNSSYSPRAQRRSIGASTSQEDDLDDFVRMIDSSHPDEISSSTGSASQTGAMSSLRSVSAPKRTSMTNYHATTSSSGVGFNRQYSLNRNQVDEMLSKMQTSVREFSTSSNSRGSGTTPSSGGESGQSLGGMGIGAGSDGSPQSNQGNHSQSQPSPSFARSPLSRVGFSAAGASIGARQTETINTGVTGPTITSSIRRPSRVENATPPYRYELPARREMHSQADKTRGEEVTSPSSKLTTLIVPEEEGEESTEMGEGEIPRHSGRTASAGSLESYTNQSRGYDPLEDEAVGKLELVHDDLGNEEGARIGSAAGGGGGGGGTSLTVSGQVGGGGGGGGGHHHHHSNDVEKAAERRRADIELARNFGQVVSSSSNRGNPRASLSPWRNRYPNQSTTSGNRSTGNGSSTGGGGGAAGS